MAAADARPPVPARDRKRPAPPPLLAQRRDRLIQRTQWLLRNERSEKAH